MSVEDELVEWISSRPMWQQSVVAGLCKQKSFDDAAIAALANELIEGKEPTGSRSVSLGASDIPGSSVAAASVSLIAIEGLQGLNALVADQELSFGATGITVVYGHNASGKSGYARLLRNMVGARVREDILGDVFAKGAAAQQHGLVRFRVGSVDSEPWTWPGAPNGELQQIHYYDKACGNAYLSATSEITYRPSAFILLDQLIVVCDAVREALDEKLRANQSARLALPTPIDGTLAARFLATLGAATKQSEIDEHCQAPEDTSETLANLLTEEARLKASDPSKERQRLESLATKLETVKTYCDGLAGKLSQQALEELAEARRSATELRAAATVASSQNFETEPLSGVGSNTWRALWEAARAYSEAEAYHDHTFPVTTAEGRCVLCQQQLSEDAADRFKRFQAFMSDTTEQEAKKAEQALAASREAVKNLSNQPPAVLNALAEIRAGDATTAETIEGWLSPIPGLCESVLTWLDGGAEAAGGALDEGPDLMLAEKATGLREQAGALDATSFAEALNTETTKKNELQGALLLAERKSAIEQEVNRLKERAAIEAAKRATDTGPITRKSSDLTRTHVTKLVRDQFTRESEGLRLRRITLDDEGGVKGQLRHRPSLLGAVSQVPVTKVLSEGEQSALGLAGFFTEATFDDTKSGIVLDDPVTSLDHVRRALVAKRLVELAGDRQIIVFTHEVTFVGDLVRHADVAHVPITERSIQRSGTDQPGVSTNKFPWKAKDVAARIDELGRLLAVIRRDRAGWDQDTYEERCSDWAGKLSEAWERTLHLEIVNEVVDRGTSQVRPRMFRIFVAITDKDNEEFQSSYGRCSEWARRHDKDPAVNFVAPEPEDMEAELKTFKEWFKRIKSYRGS